MRNQQRVSCEKEKKSSTKIGLETALRGKGNKCEVNVERRDSTMPNRERREGNEREEHFLNAALGFEINPAADRRQSAW